VHCHENYLHACYLCRYNAGEFEWHDGPCSEDHQQTSLLIIWLKWLFKKRTCAQQFQHKRYPSQLFLNPTMLISGLHCLPLHSTQNQAKRWTLSPSCPWSPALSLHRPSYLWQSSLQPTILAYTNYRLNQECMGRGRGAPAIKKLVLLRRRTDVCDVSNRRRTDVVYRRLARRRDDVDVVGSSRFYVVTTSSRRLIFCFLSYIDNLMLMMLVRQLKKFWFYYFCYSDFDIVVILSKLSKTAAGSDNIP